MKMRQNTDFSYERKRLGMKHFWKYSAYLKPHVLALSTSVFSGIVSVFLKAILPMLSVLVIDYAYRGKDLGLFTAVSIAGLCLFFLDSAFSAFTEYAIGTFNQRTNVFTASQTLERIFRLPAAVQARWKAGDLTVRVLQDSILGMRAVINTYHVVPLSVFKGVAFLSVIAAINPRIAVFALFSIPIYVFETRFYSELIGEMQANREKIDSEVNDLVEERLVSLKTIKVFARENVEVAQFTGLWRARGIFDRRQRVLSQFSVLTNSTTLQLWHTAVLWFLGFEVIQGRISIGQVIALAAYLPMLEEPIRRLSAFHSEFKIGLVSLARIDELLETPQETSSEAGGGARSAVDYAHAEIRFEDVHLSYGPGAEILRGVSFRVPPRSSLAIVGESGVGKSSVFNLLLRLIEQDRGAVLVGGVDVRGIALSELRKKIGVVFQDICIVSGTVRENLLYGNPGASAEEMIEAARMAVIHDHIAGLPHGYDTVIEKKGGDLSGGLRQRVSIARTLLLKPEILLLDEANTGLDAEADYLIQETLRRCKERMTILMVAHRLSAIKSFDRIAVLAGGVIAEEGSFPGLMLRKGLFFDLYSLQFGGFAEFKRRFEIEFERNARYGQELSLLVLEVGGADELVAGHGAQMQSLLMEKFDLFVKKKLRIMDFSAVFGLNRVVIGLPETPPAGARILVERLKSFANQERIEIAGTPFKVTFSHGVASLKETRGRYPEEIFEKAVRDLEAWSVRGTDRKAA